MTTFASVSRVYACASIASIDSLRPTHPLARLFFSRAKNFEHAVGESAQDPYWIPLIRRFKKWRFEIAAAPIPFHEIVLLKDVEVLEDQYKRCALLYPSLAAGTLECVAAARELAGCRENPLLLAVRESLGRRAWGDSLVCIAESRLIPAVEKALANFQETISTGVVNASQLRQDSTSDLLMVVGCSQWFPAFVFEAPRAKHLLSVNYAWLASRDNRSAKFNPNGLLFPSRAILGDADAAVDGNEPNAADSFTPIALQEASAFAAREADSADMHDEVGQALPVLLEDDSVAFLDGEEGATAIVIDLSEIGKKRVRRVPTSELEIGTFLLVRDGGGGDYILPIANRLLGKKVEDSRSKQQEWKALLAEIARNEGLTSVSRRLGNLGAHRARPGNVRRWIWARSIKPNDESDFVAIMRLVGRESSATDYWRTMCLIDRAHMRAGQIIRKLLLEEVHRADLKSLEQLGRMVFALPHAAGGNLVACRIKQVAKSPVEIRLSRIGHLFDAGELDWRG